MVIFITLLAGLIPLLQVTSIDVVGRITTGLTRCERSGQNYRIIRNNLYHVVSEHQVAHGKIVLIDRLSMFGGDRPEESRLGCADLISTSAHRSVRRFPPGVSGRPGQSGPPTPDSPALNI